MHATAQASWSPLWAAPEVVRLEQGSLQADIWSFGIIVWVQPPSAHLARPGTHACPATLLLMQHLAGMRHAAHSAVPQGLLLGAQGPS